MSAFYPLLPRMCYVMWQRRNVTYGIKFVYWLSIRKRLFLVGPVTTGILKKMGKGIKDEEKEMLLPSTYETQHCKRRR